MNSKATQNISDDAQMNGFNSSARKKQLGQRQVVNVKNAEN